LIPNILRAGTGLAITPGVSERLLVVDDSDTVRRAYETHFSRSGFEVEAAVSLKEAAERLASAAFSAVIVDVSLSSAAGAEGLAIAAYLRQMRSAHPPVVILTAYGEPQRASAAARLGVDAFLHKPVSLVWLEQLLRSRMNGKNGDHSSEPAAAAV
jgi:CheY-like chemotaxis protein